MAKIRGNGNGNLNGSGIGNMTGCVGRKFFRGVAISEVLNALESEPDRSGNLEYLHLAKWGL